MEKNIISKAIADEKAVVVIEPTTSAAETVVAEAKAKDRTVYVFDPMAQDCPHYNPLAGAEMDVAETLALTMRMLSRGYSTMQLDLGEQLIRNSVKVLKRLDKYDNIDGKNTTLNKLSRLMQNTQGSGRDMVQRFSCIAAKTTQEARENADIAAWFIQEYFPEHSFIYEQTYGMCSQVTNLISNENLRRVLNPDVLAGEKNDISFAKILEDKAVCYISVARPYIATLSQFLCVMMASQVYSAAWRCEYDHKLKSDDYAILIDESLLSKEQAEIIRVG